MSKTEERALTTLTLLGSRLHRLEFLLTGSSDANGIPEPVTKPTRSSETIASKLESLEEGLRRLTSSSALVQDILRSHKRFPDLFTEHDTSARPKTMDTSTEASIVLAHASSFPETASRLSSLNDLTVPPAEASAKLIVLAPRLVKVREVQERQMRQVAELRERTAKLVEHWVSDGVIEQGEIWAEWEVRVREADRRTRRLQRRRKEDGE